MSAIAAAAGLVFDPYVMLVVFGSAVFGLFVGAIPGLTATMATALLVPITFFMPPVPALGAIVAASATAIFAGDIPGAMLRMPGTPASAAYTDESYAMARRGQLELNLGVNLVFSVAGGLVGVLFLIAAAPWLAEAAINFSSFEYFWLACLGLSCATLITSSGRTRAVLSLLIGLSIGCVGIDPVAGFPRFTFGNVDLMSGISFIPTMIGAFAVSELLRGAMSGEGSGVLVQEKVGALFRGIGDVTRRYWRNFIRGSVVGTAIGALPGAGADIAAWVSYAMAKRFSKEPEKFGTGHVEGVVESTSSNNSALGGAWIPALVFGIPGDSITAIVIGVLYMKGMNPGPTVFLQNPQFIYAVFMIFILANLLMLPLGWAAIKGAARLLRAPRGILLPVILLFCIVGSFAITNSAYGILVMLIFGVVGWLMEEHGIPVAPLVLGIVLGELLEQSFMTSMMKSDGDFVAFFTRPIAGTLGAITLLVWAVIAVRALRDLRGTPVAATPGT
ncbi:MAG: C4-dicarboxylate ABC transporter permease [Betaproteobacteria bacterium]|jgi:putative tricarboxylic transport membrane protein|nr:C4-dicarboxylate ABC transporter permease [Betaproteobacteria bacterium]NBS45578.1 C4-dicarboxylate ABC transporter permease [Betaproteobacteria bacterium]